MKRVVSRLHLAAACSLLALAGCASLPGRLPVGTPIDTARHGGLLGPYAEFALADGGTRLEFPEGRQTWMLDFDARGLLVRSQQVLTEENLRGVPIGSTEDEVLRRYGRPVWIYGIGYQRQHVWNYRFDGGDCVWYQILFSDATGRVTESSPGPDPACDGPSKRD